MLTNQELADLFQKLTPRTMAQVARIRDIGNEAKKGRNTILNTLGSKPIIHEFAVDGLKSFNFHGSNSYTPTQSVTSSGRGTGSRKGYETNDLNIAAGILGMDSSNLDEVISELERGRDAIGLTTKDPIEIAETIKSERNEQSFNRGEEYGYDSSTEVPAYGYDRRNNIPKGGKESTHKGYNINELRIAADIVSMRSSDLDEIVEYLESGKDRFGLTTSDPIEIAEVIKSELDEYNNNYN